MLQRNGATLAAALAFACAVAWSRPADSAAASEPAVWVPKVLSFTYHGLTTQYSCDALRAKVKAFLLELGARSDVQVQTWGCTQPVAPDSFPGVTVQMNVLQPAASNAQAMTARWKRVDLLAKRDPLDAAADCELISQTKLNLLPLFTARNVDFQSSCTRGQIQPGATHLRADVLVTDSGAATASG